MRYAFISDVHSNLEALAATLEDIERHKPDKILFLGDAVGYGPNPNECVEILVKKSDLFLGGNHDWAAVGKTDADFFNPFAREAVDWTARELDKKSKDTLLMTTADTLYDGIHLAHSTPMEPEDWRYILSSKEAIDNYEYIKSNVCFVGHSHQPLIIEYNDADDFSVYREVSRALDPGKKYIVNIGSVGQPRDAIPDSCWVLYDLAGNTVNYHRVPYDIAAVQAKMVRAGLPKYLIERLSLGR